jgi:hypothetical protein
MIIQGCATDADFEIWNGDVASGAMDAQQLRASALAREARQSAQAREIQSSLRT